MSNKFDIDKVQAKVNDPSCCFADTWVGDIIRDWVRIQISLGDYIAGLETGTVYQYGRDGQLTEDQCNSIIFDLTRIQDGHQALRDEYR